MVANKFDQKVLGGITPPGAKTMSEKKKTPPDSLPSKPDEVQEEDIKTEIYVLINGKRIQLVEKDGTFHLANKDKGHGISVTQKGDIIMVSGSPSNNGDVCGGRILINARGGQMYKGGAITVEASADEGQAASGQDGASTTEKQGTSGATESTEAGKGGVACSHLFYGDHHEECHGNIHLRGKNITLDAVETLTLIAGTEIKIQSGPKSGGGDIVVKGGQVTLDTDILVEKVGSTKIIDGTPETTRVGYDPRTSENTLGWFNVNTNITGDYKLTVGGCMETQVIGAAPPTGVLPLVVNRLVGYNLSVTAGSMNLSTLAGSALFSFGFSAENAFGGGLPDLIPGSFDIKALAGVGISAGEFVSLPELPSVGKVAISAVTSVDVDATTDVNITANKDVNINATTGDISILTTAGKIYLN